MALAKCIYCGREQEDFKGTYLIKNEGIMVYYCSGKCQRNHLKLKRDRRRIKWTEAYRETKEKHLAAEKRHAEHVAQDKAAIATPATKKKASKK